MSQEIQVPYEECGHKGTARVGQIVASNRLHWYRSISCPDCGHIEEDGVGLPPAHLRDPLLKECGTWKLIAKEVNRVAAVKVIRSALAALDVSVEETTATLRRFPVLYIGTKTEAEFLNAQMEASNLGSQIVVSAES